MSPGQPADGRRLPCTKLPCVLCWALGGHPQLQPHRVGADGGPRAPSRPWLSSKQPWAGSVLEGAARPAVVWAAPAPREAVGASVCVCGGRRRSRGSPRADVPSHVAVTEATLSAPWGPLPSRARPRVTDPASLLPTLSLCRPACPGPRQLLAKALRPAGLPSPRCPYSRCDPAPGGPSPRMWGSLHLVLAVAAPSAPCCP